MVGLVLAALGLILRQVTGSPVWDGAASIAIGCLLIVVASGSASTTGTSSSARAADPRELAAIRPEIERRPAWTRCSTCSPCISGPEHLIVAARVAFSDDISADRAEDVADDIDQRLADRLPLVPHVFLDPTQTPSGPRPAGQGTARLLARRRLPWARPDSRAAVSSMPACTKACGRLPRNWRWCTSYSSVYRPAGPQAARLRSNQCAASASCPHACATCASQNPQSRNAPSALCKGRASWRNRYTYPSSVSSSRTARTVARARGSSARQGAADHRQQQRGIDPRVGG